MDPIRAQRFVQPLRFEIKLLAKTHYIHTSPKVALKPISQSLGYLTVSEDGRAGLNLTVHCNWIMLDKAVEKRSSSRADPAVIRPASTHTVNGFVIVPLVIANALTDGTSRECGRVKHGNEPVYSVYCCVEKRGREIYPNEQDKRTLEYLQLEEPPMTLCLRDSTLESGDVNGNIIATAAVWLTPTKFYGDHQSLTDMLVHMSREHNIEIVAANCQWLVL
ncbi:hypothetical protein AJ78_02269 [Emergomyces pasteurianus Ep9510]|uniref:Uncharacterized protein n=1 Tax=Emergomyces pasteurianus Ep9510 TaxID=1447872 RepID=A0A1J9PNF7_9EURO|nr:hypothetical protein AJ78_02269 [Emergomyces pasteurianus Ep9510]